MLIHPYSLSLTLISPGVIEEVENWDQNVQHITALQHIKHEFLKHRNHKHSITDGNRWAVSTKLVESVCYQKLYDIIFFCHLCSRLYKTIIHEIACYSKCCAIFSNIWKRALFKHRSIDLCWQLVHYWDELAFLHLLHYAACNSSYMLQHHNNR